LNNSTTKSSFLLELTKFEYIFAAIAQFFSLGTGSQTEHFPFKTMKKVSPLSPNLMAA